VLCSGNVDTTATAAGNDKDKDDTVDNENGDDDYEWCNPLTQHLASVGIAGSVLLVLCGRNKTKKPYVYRVWSPRVPYECVNGCQHWRQAVF
jgi:hypothetical protein